jgi:predicted porin
VATSAVQGTAWDAGASYETGPYGVSVTYYELSQEATRAVPANDDLKAWSVAGKYTAGPGVVFDLSGVHMDYKNEDKTDRNSTKGLAVIGGVRLAF